MSSLQDNNYHDSELIIGLVGPTGTNLDYISNVITKLLEQFSYHSHIIKISKDIIALFGDVTLDNLSPSERVHKLMDRGNELRLKRDDLLALATAYKILELRENVNSKRKAYVICSLKHPSEVQTLRKIYSNGFFLIGVSAKESDRLAYLSTNKFIDAKDAQELSKRDIKENIKYGQQVSDTFHLSDFFISYGSDYQKVQNDLKRIIDLIFGKPFVTPTFDEYAMFMAFSASLRSADLSRQVGAVITKNENIISTGANDIPKSGGGLYWPEFDKDTKTIKDKDSGRDYMLGYDSNAIEKTTIINSIVALVPEEFQKEFRKKLNSSPIKDITEYGRVVHAEMEAILSCARNSISTQEAHIYCTTFPCHNCAKHIIASGIHRVVYVEPYPKSKAYDFHKDSIILYEGEVNLDHEYTDKVVFVPFVGVGPRNFYNLFSMNQGSGYPLERKDSEGNTIVWQESTASLRMHMIPNSYVEREQLAVTSLEEFIPKEEDTQNEQP